MGLTSSAVPVEARSLRMSAAFLWLATGLLIVHPVYREIGTHYLARLGLPPWPMYVACVGEVLLGLRVAFGPASTWVTAVQLLAITGFTVTLAAVEPILLVSPYGVLTKNLPLMAVIGTAWLLEREGWSRRAWWLLRSGIAVIWLTEGLFPKLIFQQAAELTVVASSGWAIGGPAVFLRVLGGCEVVAGVLTLVLHGRPLRWLLLAEMVGLVVLPLLVSTQDSMLWVHPFGPLTKNVPILVGTWVLWRRV
jgi:hypothetical protein